MVDVADLADRGHAGDGNTAKLARREPKQGESALLGHELRHNAGRAGQLSALAGVKLHIVDERTDRDVLQRKRVARLNATI
jgi:hypothetical protein